MGRRHEVASVAPRCLECGGRPELVPVARAYPHLRGEARSPVAWLCRCGAAVSCHSGSLRPMGHAAGRAAAAARAAGHRLLDEAVETGEFGDPRDRHSVTRCYRWLAEELSLPVFHFGEATQSGAERACVLLHKRLRRHARSTA